jgi:hypothetical protein
MSITTLVVTFTPLSDLDLDRLRAGLGTIRVVDVRHLIDGTLDPETYYPESLRRLSQHLEGLLPVGQDTVICGTSQEDSIIAMALYHMLLMATNCHPRIAWINSFPGSDRLLDVFSPADLANGTHHPYAHA